jgi:hypothetical protein
MQQPFRFLADDGQGIIDSMGDAGGQLPDGGQFLGLQQLLPPLFRLLLRLGFLSQNPPDGKIRQCRQQQGDRPQRQARH